MQIMPRSAHYCKTLEQILFCHPPRGTAVPRVSHDCSSRAHLLMRGRETDWSQKTESPKGVRRSGAAEELELFYRQNHV